MDENQIFIRIGLALAIGFLIGVERGWRERDEAEGERAAGLRTFALIGLFGGIWGLLARELGPAPFGLAFLAIAGALTLFRWRETQAEGIRGMTTLVAGFLTFSLGAYAVLGDMAVAAAAAVATTALLSAKEWLHSWLRVLTWQELRAALILLAMTFVALPVLPDRGFGPYGALNPYEIWLMTVVIAGVSFIGYVAVKVAGERYGSLIAGLAGGLVSSTATTLDLARRTRAEPSTWRLRLSGAFAASTVMFVRVGVVVALFGPILLGRLRRAARRCGAGQRRGRSCAQPAVDQPKGREGAEGRRRPAEPIRTPPGDRLRAAACGHPRPDQGADRGLRRPGRHRLRGPRRACRCRRDHPVDDPAREHRHPDGRRDRDPDRSGDQFAVQVGAGAVRRRPPLRHGLSRRDRLSLAAGGVVALVQPWS